MAHAEEYKGRVLLVEHNDDNRTILGSALRRAGYEVVEAANCQVALSAIEKGGPFGVVYINQEIPGGGALGVLGKARQVDGQSRYVVGGTSPEFGDTKVEFYQAGAASCLDMASTSSAALCSIVEKLLARDDATLVERLGKPTLTRIRGIRA